jgi:hypothetical protein
MAIATVRVQINGTWTTLTYNSTSKAYEATITAPGTTSFNLSGGYYPVVVEATNTAGTTARVDATTATIGTSLRLVVKETVAPVITITSPTSGARVVNNKQPVVFTVTDASGGSGVNLSSIVVKQDGTAVAASTITSSAITNGYTFTYTPAAAMSDGAHTITVDAKDNDGNSATQKTTTFTIDTVPPVLNISSPTEGFITNSTSVVASGTTNDATSSPVTMTQALDGGAAQAVTVASNGTFTKTWSGLTHGTHYIDFVAKDSAGKTSTVRRNFTVDTSTPVISSVTISPNPANTSGSMVLKVVVTG